MVLRLVVLLQNFVQRFDKKMAKKYYYAVQNGRSEGVYSSWDDCKQQVSGYGGAVYKKFDSYEAANSFSNSNSGYSGSSSTGNNSRSSGSSGSSSSYGSGNSSSSYGSGNASSSYGSSSYGSSSYGSRNTSSSYGSGNNSSSYGSRNTSSSYGSGNNSSSYGSSATYNYPSYSVSKPSVTKKATSTTNQNYYAVKSNNPAISSKVFRNWNDCKDYVHKQKGLSFMKFSSENGAADYINGSSNSASDYQHINQKPDDFARTYKFESANGKKYTKSSNVYCDGSSLSNGTSNARAGYGVYFEGRPENNISERLRDGAQTNNRGEIQAVSSALETIWNDLTTKEDKQVFKIKTDSEYVVKLLNDRYHAYSDEKIATLANNDLIKPLIHNYVKVKQYYEVNKDQFDESNKFSVEWVKGHAGHEGNEIADELARNGAATN